jgi:hypothetical protein
VQANQPDDHSTGCASSQASTGIGELLERNDGDANYDVSQYHEEPLVVFWGSIGSVIH